MELFKHDTNYPFIPRMKVFIITSIVACVLSVLAVAGMGLNYGIDFAGGYEIQARFPTAVTDTQIRDALGEVGLPGTHVQRFGSADSNEFLILVREGGNIDETRKEELKKEFEALAGGVDAVTNWAFAENGESLQVGFNTTVTEEQVRGLLDKYKLQVKSLSRSEREDRPEFSVQLVSMTNEIDSALRQKFSVPEGTSVIQRVEFVGPQVGAELRNQGLMAMIYAMLFILLYMAIRFDFFFAPGAVVATVHDLVVVMGVYALTGIEFNLQAIAALLTLLGYSINDKVVVFDRIRENLAKLRGRDLRGLVNTSINQTLSRTILTSGGTCLVVGALFIMGDGPIADFAIMMLVGILVGTYSSIGIAAPIYILLRERSGDTAKASTPVHAA